MCVSVQLHEGPREKSAKYVVYRLYSYTQETLNDMYTPVASEQQWPEQPWPRLME